MCPLHSATRRLLLGPRAAFRAVCKISKIAAMLMMLAGGAVAWRLVELHPPISLLDVLLPRV
jgi:hypothetical protein